MAGRELRWIRPALFERAYELRSGETVVAELKFASAFGRTANANSADNSWVFEQTGFLKTRLIVRESSSSAEIASLVEKRTRRSQEISVADGSRFVIRFNFWGTAYTLETTTGEVLASTQRRGFFRVDWPTEIRHKAKTYPELTWLVLLMWYYILIRKRREHAH